MGQHGDNDVNKNSNDDNTNKLGRSWDWTLLQFYVDLIFLDLVFILLSGLGLVDLVQ